jgi:hypothetical protein
VMTAALCCGATCRHNPAKSMPHANAAARG